jgi:hypothetical protein
VSLHVSAQKTFTLKDLFTEDTVVWYGIDYTKAKFIGEFGDKDLRGYFHGWNRLITEEPYKYDVSRTLQKRKASHDIGYIGKINKESVPHISSFDDDSILRSSDFPAMIAAYQGKRDEGIGVVFIAERYHRPKNFATHYAIIFDIASKKILISQKYTAVPDGIGLRNYWANTILESLHALAKNYKKWKKKYGSIVNGAN